MSKHKPRAYSISDFISWHDKKELVLQPKFQRRDVWSAKAKSHLIDSILRDLPIPIIFIRQAVDPARSRTIREVVDGQQRLNAVLGYFKDQFPVLKSQNPSWGDLTFSQLTAEAQQQFLGYEFSVVLLEGTTDAEILDIFARLNTYSLKLTPQEFLNSQYFGEFKKTVYSLGYKHLEFWRENKILRDSQILRMAEAELTSELVLTMLDGIQHRRGKISAFYEDYDDEFPEKQRVRKEFRSVIDTIAECFGERLKRSIFKKRAMFHSLFCAFYHVMYGIPGARVIGKGAILPQPTVVQLAKIREALIDLERKYKLFNKAEKPRNIREFFEASQTATADKPQRIARIKTIVNHIYEAVK